MSAVKEIKQAKKAAMIATLKQANGIVSLAAEKIGIHRSTHYEWLQNDPEYAKAVLEIQDRVTDWVESKLYDNIRNGDVASIFFYLKTKGKNRGYAQENNIQINQVQQANGAEVTQNQAMQIIIQVV